MTEVFVVGDVGGTNTRLVLYEWDMTTDKEGQPTALQPPDATATHRTPLDCLPHSSVSHCHCYCGVWLAWLGCWFCCVRAVKLAEKIYPSKKYNTLTDAVKEFLNTVSRTHGTQHSVHTTDTVERRSRARCALTSCVRFPRAVVC